MNPRGGAWGGDGTIIFRADGGNGDGLQRVSSAGGTPAPLTTPGPGKGNDQRFPAFLPDGRRYLYRAGDENAIYSGSLDSDQARLIATNATSGGVYSRSGHVLFLRQSVLVAQPVDAAELTSAGDALPVAQNLWNRLAGAPSFSLSETGTLAYGVLDIDVGLGQLDWVDRTGKTIQTLRPEGGIKGIEIARDQRRVLFHRDETTGSGGDVWLPEVERGGQSRLTLDGPQHHSGPAILSPDGSQIAYSNNRFGKWAMYIKPSNGVGEERRLLESSTRAVQMSWSPNGQMIVLQQATPKMGEDIWVLPLTGEMTPVLFQGSVGADTHPQVSPDGRWIAYASNETRTSEVYVRSFPSGNLKRIVSTDGGGFPRWSADGKERFYVMGRLRGYGTQAAVEFMTTPSGFELGRPKELFQNNYFDMGPDIGGNYHTCAVSADGQRFLIPRISAAAAKTLVPDPIVVVLNWAQTLK